MFEDHAGDPPDLPPARMLLPIVAAFFLIATVIYGGGLNHPFVRWDDGMLIYENPAIRTIAPWSLKRIFTTYDPELYIPLTFLTYQIDYLIGGIQPFVYHLDNLILHTLNALLSTWFIFLLTRRRGIALLTGLLFLVHPIQVEAVEWASARKDVLSTFFFLLSIIAYLSWRASASRRTRWLSVGAFILGLLSKVMVITLPVVLLLIDWREGRNLRSPRMWLEKWPYVLWAVVFGIIGLFGKRQIVSSTTLTTKVLMAFKSAVFYLKQIVWPAHFSLLYPNTHRIVVTEPAFYVPIIVFILLAIVAIVLLRRTRDPLFAFLFYLVTVAPTFLNFAKGGELDVYFGSDRYAYVPSIGVLFILTLAAAFCVKKMALKRTLCARVVFGGSGVILLLLGAKSHAQTAVWQSTRSLFMNVIEHYPEDSYIAHNNLGNAERLDGDLAEAEKHFRIALSIKKHPKTLANLGAVQRKRGEIMEAIETYREALTLDPKSADAHLGLGIVYAHIRDYPSAHRAYDAAIRLDPTKPVPSINLGALLAAQGDYDGAIVQYNKALAIDPYQPDAYFNLGYALAAENRTDDAIAAYETSLELEPSASAFINLGMLYHNANREDDAIAAFRGVLEIDPDNAAAWSALRQLGAL